MSSFAPPPAPPPDSPLGNPVNQRFFVYIAGTISLVIVFCMLQGARRMRQQRRQQHMQRLAQMEREMRLRRIRALVLSGAMEDLVVPATATAVRRLPQLAHALPRRAHDATGSVKQQRHATTPLSPRALASRGAGIGLFTTPHQHGDRGCSSRASPGLISAARASAFAAE